MEALRSRDSGFGAKEHRHGMIDDVAKADNNNRILLKYIDIFSGKYSKYFEPIL